MDEFHIVLEWSFYIEIRKSLIPPVYWTNPNMQNFIELINNKNENMIRKLSIFIEKAFARKNSKYY